MGNIYTIKVISSGSCGRTEVSTTQMCSSSRTETEYINPTASRSSSQIYMTFHGLTQVSFCALCFIKHYGQRLWTPEAQGIERNTFTWKPQFNRIVFLLLNPGFHSQFTKYKFESWITVYFYTGEGASLMLNKFISEKMQFEKELDIAKNCSRILWILFWDTEGRN